MKVDAESGLDTAEDLGEILIAQFTRQMVLYPLIDRNLNDQRDLNFMLDAAAAVDQTHQPVAVVEYQAFFFGLHSYALYLALGDVLLSQNERGLQFSASFVGQLNGT